MEFLLLLGTPLLGALVLGVVGARRWAPELNVAVSLVTFLAACALTARVIESTATSSIAHEQFFIDPFNVFLVTLTALRRPHDLALLASLHARRDRSRASHRGAAASLSQHVSALHDDDADRAHDQQHGAPMGGDGGGNALHRTAGDAVSHAGESRGRVEVLHPLRRRHRPGTLRHDPPLLRRRERSWAPRASTRAPVDTPQCRQRVNSSPQCSALRSSSSSSATARR